MVPEILKHLERRVTQPSSDDDPDTASAHTVHSVYAAMSAATAIAAGFHNGIGFDTLAHLTCPEAIRP